MNNELSLEIKTYADQVNKSLSDLKNQINNISNDVGKNQQKIKGFTDSVKSTFNVTAIVAVVKTASRAVFGFINDANDYSEALNLFNVVLDNTENKLSDVGKAGLKFQNTLAEAFGVQRTQAMTYQALYQSMAENMGIVEDKSYIMSENTTKLVNDLSSLYNKSEATTAEALRAGIYAGQTKPLRSFGLDVTERSLTPVLESLGIDDRTVRELNQAEKQILRYIAVLRQSAVAHGDWANTIESPSNQLKIFKNQLVETSVALGRLFQSAFANVLPYVNAFLMVVKEVAKAIANFFGLDLGDYNSSIASVDTSYEDLSDNIDGATEATKKLKRETLSFDQIHNIDDPDTSGGGGGVSGIGGVDQRLLDAIEGYDNGMDKVKMKATEIRDRIMEWLGFTKHVDAETGEVYFTYDGLGKTLSNMWKSFKNLNTQGKILVGLGLVVGATKLWNVSKKLLNTIGNSGLGKAVKNLLSPTKTLAQMIKVDLAGGFYNLGSSMSESISLWSSTLSLMDKFKVSLTGVIGLTASTWAMGESMRSVAEEGWNLSNALGATASTLGGMASGALIGSVFGPAGTLIGGVAGLITEVVAGFHEYNQAVEEIRIHNTVFDEQGVKLEKIIEQFSGVFDESIKYIGALDNLKIKYEEAKESVTSAKNEIDGFKTSLDLQEEAVSQTQLDTLSSKYDTLKQKTKEASTASVEYGIALIKAYSSSSEESTTSTATQIANLNRLAAVQEEKDQKYIDRLYELDTKYYSGKMSASDYEQAVNDLNVIFGYSSEVILNSAGAIDNFNQKINNIDYTNAETLKENITGIGEEYQKTIETLNGQKDSITGYWNPMIEEQQGVIDNYENIIRSGQTLSEEQQYWYDNAKETVETYRNNMDTQLSEANKTIETIQGSYKGFLATVYADLVNSGADASEEFKGTIEKIESDLNGLKEIDMSGAGKTMFDSFIDSIVREEGTRLPQLQNKFSQYAIEAGDSFNSAIDSYNQEHMGDYLDSFSETGRASTQGYRNGISCDINDNGAGGDYLAKKSIEFACDILDSHSPSRVFVGIGEDTLQGYINGIKNKQGDLLSAVNSMLEELKRKFQEVQFSFNISTSVEGSFNSILSKLETFINKFRSGINNLLSRMTSSMNNVYVGSDNRLYYSSMPYISVPRFANGGFPEDGWFRASKGELMGKFDDGQSVVANNMQIIEGIKNGVAEGMLLASQYNNNTSNVNVNVTADKGFIVDTVVEGVNEIKRRTGTCPIEVL